jgi:hypothetical protein
VVFVKSEDSSLKLSKRSSTKNQPSNQSINDFIHPLCQVAGIRHANNLHGLKLTNVITYLFKRVCEKYFVYLEN